MPLLRRNLIILLEIAAALVGVGCVLFALLFWRLLQGPLVLDELAPAIERAAASQLHLPGLGIGGASITWDGETRRLGLTATEVTIRGADGQTALRAPEVEVGFSLTALARGEVVPQWVGLRRLGVRLVLDPQGRLSVGLDSGAAPAAGATTDIDALLARLAPLHGIAIRDAGLTLVDLARGRSHHASGVDLTLRLAAGAAELELAGALDTAAGPVRLAASLRRSAGGVISADARVAGLALAALAAELPELKDLAGSSLAFDIAGSATLSPAGDLISGELSVTAAAGTVALPAFYPEPLAVEAVAAKLVARPDGVTAEQLRLSLPGTTVSATGSLSLGAAPRWSAVLGLDTVATDRLMALWPVNVGAKARVWIAENIEHGRVGDLQLAASGGFGPGGLVEPDIDDLVGGFALHDITVHYLRPLPPVLGVTGSADFDLTDFRLTASGGRLRGIRVASGEALFSKLDTNDEQAAITVNAKGSLADIMWVLDHRPLGYAKRFDIDPARLGGQAEVKLDLAFPLIRTLKTEEVDIRAAAKAEGVAWPGVAMGRDLTAGALALDLTVKAMRVTGQGRFDGIPVTLDWREQFDAPPGAATILRRVAVKGRVADDERLRLGIDLAPFITGPADVSLEMAFPRRGDFTIAVDADLAPASLALAELGWAKPPGVDGRARATLTAGGDRLKAMPRLSVTAPALAFAGGMEFGPDSKWSALRIDSLEAGATRLTGRLAPLADGGLAIEAEGPSFDAQALYDAEEENPPPSTSLIIDARFASLRLQPDRALSDVRLRADRQGQHWRLAELTARVGADAAVSATLSGRPDGLADLVVRSADAGALFRELGWTEAMVGGALEVEAVARPLEPGRPFTGKARITNLTMVRAPLMTRILTLASLTGIVAALNGDGIRFNLLEADVGRDRTHWRVDGRAAGASLGILAKGALRREDDTVDVSGMVVPAYGLNEMIGAIPLLGPLITGGQGQGLIAAEFTVKGPVDTAEVSVNPLSVLAPGILRTIFRGLFEGGVEAPGPVEPRYREQR